MPTYQKLLEKESAEGYSVQHVDVIPLIKKGLYRPLWSMSDAAKKEDHKIPYRLMREKFWSQKKCLVGNDLLMPANFPEDYSLFWFLFEKKRLREMLKHKRKGCLEALDKKYIVTLDIPMDEILVSLYDQWVGILSLHDNKLRSSELITEEVEEEYEAEYKKSCEESFKHLFNIAADCELSKLQGVVDRVEPAWIKQTMEAYDFCNREC